MAVKPYQDKEWLYQHYVKKRMNLTDIVKLLEDKYNIKISQQALYNWVEKNDLLKYRGKGRKLKIHQRTATKTNASADRLKQRADQIKKIKKNQRTMKRK